MEIQPNQKTREKQILNKVLTMAKGKGHGGKMGPFDPYAKTMVPVPPYITTGSPTPSDNTSINYARRLNGDLKAGRAISKISQIDRAPVAKDKTNKWVGKIYDEQNLKKSNK